MGMASASTADCLAHALQDQTRSELRGLSDAGGCLMPLLAALNWHGEPRDIAEAAPHFADGIDIGDLRKILSSLKFATRQQRVRLANIDPRLLPCLFAPDSESLMVVLGVDGNGYQVLNGATGELTRSESNPLGEAYFISESADEDNDQRERWSSALWRRFKPFFLKIFLITGLTSALALTVPLLIKSLYDYVIPAKSISTLIFLGFGMLIVVVSEGLLRLIRARLIAYIGGRTDLIVGTAALCQLLRIPVSMTERTSIGAQVSSLQQFEILRESFVGPLAAVFFELPFVLLAIAVIAVVAGPIAWIPAILTAVFLVVAAISYPRLRRLSRVASGASSRRNAFLMETVTHLRAVKEAGAGDIWSQRHRDISATAAQAQYRVTRANAFLQTISQQLMLLAGIAILGLGASRVMQDSMTIGSLIAVMALTWRVLGPLQSGLVNLSRLHQVIGGLRQMDRLMGLTREKEPTQAYRSARRFKGRVTFDRVSMRYIPDGTPALLGISFAVEPGEVLAITGASGSGKSTVIRLLLGLYTPQGGAVSLDGIDIRQLDVGELRSTISYMPQSTQLFHGTIAQNLRLTNPVATDVELRQAVECANMLREIQALPDGLDTRLTDAARSQFSGGFLRKLCMAQTYLKRAKIYLFDEPGSNIDHEDDRVFAAAIEGIRGRGTVILVTQRPSHIRLADKVLVLHNGGGAFFGTPDEFAAASSR